MAAADLPLSDLQRYAPEVAEPADFDAFWRDTLAAAAEHPVPIDRRPKWTGLRLIDSPMPSPTAPSPITFRCTAMPRMPCGERCRMWTG